MTNWLTYANSGATRNQPLSPELVAALGFLPELGITASVYSGGQPGVGSGGARVGSTRHDHGGAGDIHLTHSELGMLSHRNPDHIPILQEVVRRAVANGITGIGMGDGYMGDHGIHLGFGAPAVWGAGGSGENAPQWLRDAYYGAEPGQVPYDPTRPPSVFNQPPSNAFTGMMQPEQQDNALTAFLSSQTPNVQNVNAFMRPMQQVNLLPIPGTMT